MHEALKKRFHLNKWYHRAYLIFTVLIAWNQVSYFSLINWLATCIFIWFSGYKFLSKQSLQILKIFMYIHTILITSIMLLIGVWMWDSYNMSKEEDNEFKIELKNNLDYHFSVTLFGYKDIFSHLFEQFITYIVVLVLLLISIRKLNEPDNEFIIQQSEEERQTFAQQQSLKPLSENEIIEAHDDHEDELFTFNQQRVAYERQSAIIQKNMYCITFLTIINDGLSTFLLMICLLIWLMVYFHNIDNTERFKVCRIVNITVSVISFLALYSMLIPSLSYFSDNHPNTCLIISGTLMLNQFIKAMIILLITWILLLSVRVIHYHSILDIYQVAQVDNAIEQEKRKTRSEQQSPSTFSIIICQNYYGVMLVLSICWISKEFSILRGIVLLLLVVGMLKRYRFKARKRWQTSIAILYVACLQFILNLLYNIPVFFESEDYQGLFNFFGMHEIPKYVPRNQDNFGMAKYYWMRTSSVLVDLLYILILTWLVYSQQSLDDKRYKKMINELVFQKLLARKQDDKAGGWNKFKSQVLYYWKEFRRSFLIHFDKLVIFVCLLISLHQADIFRATFLLFFIMYAFLDLQERKRYMRAHVNLNFIILFTLYTLDLIFYQNMPVLNGYAQELGMNDFSDPHLYIPFYFAYQFYDIILGTLLLTFQLLVVYKTDTMIKYKKHLQTLSQYDEQQNDLVIRPFLEEEQQMIVKVYKMLDPMKSFFINYGILMCQLIILLVAFIPPANLLSLVYIFFFQSFLYMNYIYGSQEKIMDKIVEYYGIMIVLSIIIIVIRYIYTISIINILVELIFTELALLGDLGLDPNLNTLKLIGNGLVLQLLASYRRLYKSKMYEMLKQHYKIVRQEERKSLIDHRNYAYTFYAIKSQLAIFAVYHLQKLIFIFAFYIAIYQQSYIGIVFACMIFLVIFKEQTNNWTNISIPLFAVLFVQIFIQYTFQSTVLQKVFQGEETVQWIGIQDQYDRRYWTLMIYLHCCELLPLVYAMCQFHLKPILDCYSIKPQDREILHLAQWNELLTQLHSAFLIVKTRRDTKPLNQDEQDSYIIERSLGSVSIDSEKSSLSLQPKITSNLELNELLDPLHTPSQRFSVLKKFFHNQNKKVQYREYLLTLPVYRGLRIHQQLDQFFTQVGLEICLFFMVITAYYQRNFFSVFYIIVASIFANFSSSLQKHQHNKGITVFKFALNILCVLMMLEVMRKYLIIQWTPPSWDIRKAWWYWSYTCNQLGKSAFNDEDPNDQVSDFMKCQTDWNYWLSLNGYQHLDIWITFFAFLITINFIRHFTTIERLQFEQRMKDEARHVSQIRDQQNSLASDINLTVSSQGDEDINPNDFTYGKNRRKISDFIKFYVFCYFYKFPLIIFLLIGVSSDISSYTEIISCIYFFIAIYLLYSSQKLETRKHLIWDNLILFNTIIMILMSLYQAPFVKCPVLYEEGRYYYDNTECVYIQQTNHYYNSDFFIFIQDQFQMIADRKDHIDSHQNINTFDVIYMFLSHILGLNKTLDFRLGFSRETLMALFFFLGLIQRNIWQHEHTKKFVEPFFQRQQDKQRLAAIQLVEGIHLRRIWDFKYTQAQKECHDSMQERVSQRVKKWDEFFQIDDYKRSSFFYSAGIQQELNRRTRQDGERVTMIRFEEGVGNEISNHQHRIHTSFESEDFEKLKKDDEQKIILAEQIVQNNKAPVIQLFDACAIVQEAQDDSELLSILLEELKLLEEKSLLENIYLNEKIGLFQYYDQIMVHMDLEIKQIIQEKHDYLKTKAQFQISQDNEKIVKEEVTEEEKSSILEVIPRRQKQIRTVGLLELDNLLNLDSSIQDDSEQPQPDSAKFVTVQVSTPHLLIAENQLETLRQEDHKSESRESSFSVSESAESLPDPVVESEQISPNRIPNEVQKVPIAAPRKKHSALKNLWLSFKQIIREFLISILTQDTYLRESVIRKQEIDRKKLGVLIFFFIAHYFVIICAIMMVINTCYNANILAIFLPLSAFLYGMIENPVQNKRYWNFLLIYVMTVISLKFIYQMPVFCDSPPYSFIGFSSAESCEPRVTTINEKITRIDYIIGIRKFNSSEGETFLKNVWIELVLFIFFLIQRFLLQIQGIWDHVKLSNDRYYIPQFQEKKRKKIKPVQKKGDKKQSQNEADEEDDFSELSKLIKEDSNISQQVEKVTFTDKVNSMQTSTQLAITEFFYRVFPTFQPIVFVQSMWQKTKKDTKRQNVSLDDFKKEQQPNIQQADSDNGSLRQIDVRSYIISQNQLDLEQSYAQRVQNQEVVKGPIYESQILVNQGGEQNQFLSASAEKQINIQPQGQWKLEQKEAIIFPEQIKTGRDIYVPGFVICMVILVYFLLFYPNIISKRSYAHITQGKSQRFSSEVIFVLLLVITIIVIDRMLFIIRKVTKNPNDIQAIIIEQENASQREDFSKYTLIIKATMHITLIFVVHYYFFFVIPRKTNRNFSESPYLIIGYLLICIYFLVSSLQIRYGYPVSETSQVFTGSKERVNSTAFTVYRAIPFLYELKIIIDWTFTRTALDLLQWFKLEDIFSNLYTCQAYMNYRQKHHKLGQSRDTSEKCSSGFLYALLLIFIIILPILIFSSLNPAVEINNIEAGHFVVKASFIGEEDKLFFTLFQVHDIELLDIQADQFKAIQRVYGEVESSWQERMQKIRIKRFSDQEWNLPENYRDQIRKMIKSQDYEVEVECEWSFQKSDKNGGTKTYTGSNKVIVSDSFVNNFGKILAPKSPDANFDINKLLPKFIYVGESAETEILRLQPVNIREEQNSYYQDLRLLHRKTGDQVFFELIPNDKSVDLKQIGALESSKVEFFVLNELAFGSIIGAMSNNVSIIGIYATFVLAVGRFIRLTYDKISMRVSYEEMPYVGELFDLCQSIYIARVDGNLKKEEIFYELLIRIYRSPEILFKMTGTSIYDQQNK